jgi:hypothetical protein
VIPRNGSVTLHPNNLMRNGFKNCVRLLVLCAVFGLSGGDASARRWIPKIAAGGGGGNTVTIDSTSLPSRRDSAGTTITVTNTVGSGSNRLLVIMVGVGDSSGVTDRSVNSVTSDQGGTFVAYAAGDDANFCRAEIWYLVAPATGTHIVTITCSTGGGSTTEILGAGARSYTGVDQSTPFGTAVNINGTSASNSPTTGSITVGTGGAAIAVLSTDSQGSLSVSVGTEVFETEDLNSDVDVGGATRTSTGSITWTTAISEKYAITGGAINAAP